MFQDPHQRSHGETLTHANDCSHAHASYTVIMAHIVGEPYRKLPACDHLADYETGSEFAEATAYER